MDRVHPKPEFLLRCLDAVPLKGTRLTTLPRVLSRKKMPQREDSGIIATYGDAVAKPSRVRFRVDPQSSLPARQQIRYQLVIYVHLGLIGPGARLPAVRELAAQTGLNLKTAFRIYRRLAREELVQIQPQRGVFVKFSARAARRSHHNALESFLHRALREARQLNLSPLRLTQLLAVQAGIELARPVCCAVVECNREQTHLFSEELRRKLNVEAFPVSTLSSPAARERALRRADVFVTTDFHWEEVQRWAAQHRKEAYRIRLNPAFHRMLVRNARRGLFPMVLTSVSFEDRFRRALAGSTPPEVAERLVFVHYRNRARVNEALQRARRAYVSPLCYEEVARQAPDGVQLLTLRDMISPDSLQALRRNLLVPQNRSSSSPARA